ncbi:hypothetical protein TRVA0_005S03290 [Trichomonascus vanleenenianus]|uniref:linker nucleoporin NUP82 n=1 Tax=Trichomonascus vanleenenianus TaxID=2268995 RepID=UPI003EC96194
MSEEFTKRIVEHGIFKTKDEETQFVQRFGSDLEDVGATRNLMCSRGDELFLAVANTVRCVDLSSPSGGSYKNLELKEVDFAIRGLAMNESGTLLAIVGHHKVVAAVLPNAGFLKSPERTVKVRNRLVRNVSQSGDTVVLKAAWNPIARHDSNLVLLTSDGYLRAYDLATNYEQPELEYCLTSSRSQGGQFGIEDDEIEDPVSFALGTAADAHGKMTMYVLTKGGDVFALCPWLPNQFLLGQGEIEDVFDGAVADEYEHRHSKQSSSGERQHYKQQLAWASQLWKQMTSSAVESRLAKDGVLYDQYVLRRPEKQTPEIQGPFSFKPFPRALYEGEATDIAAVDAGGFTALCIATSTGRVSVFLQDASIDVQLAGSEVSSNTTLATLESIAFPGGSMGRQLGLQCDPTGQEMVLAVYDTNSAFRVDMRPWALPLAHAVATGDMDAVRDILDQSPHSAVDRLVNDKDRSGFHGVAVIEDEAGSQYTVAKTGYGVWVEQWGATYYAALPDAASALPAAAGGGAPHAAPSTGATREEEKLRYESLLDDRKFENEVRYMLDGVDLTAPRPKAGVALTEKFQPSLEHLEYFTELVNFYTVELGKLNAAAKTMHGRLTYQRMELNRQLEKLNTLSEKVLTISNSSATTRLHEALMRQTQIRERSSAVLEKLAKCKAIMLSDQEKKWFAELQRLQKKVYTSGGLEKRVKNALLQTDIIHKEVTLINRGSKGSVTTDAYTQDNVLRLQTLLSKEGEIIEATKKQLQRILAESQVAQTAQIEGLVEKSRNLTISDQHYN